MTKRRVVMRVLITMITTLVGIEAGLRWIDPFGIEAYTEIDDLQQAVVDHPTRGYIFTPGTYQTDYGTVAIRDDYSRRVPDTNSSAGCTLVFIGDSVTFGAGVGDSATWVNLVAQRLPDVHVINASMTGYNSAQIRSVYDDYAGADVFVYLIIDNDPYDGFGGVSMPTWDMPATSRAIIWFHNQSLPRRYDWDRFYADLDYLQRDPRVVFVAFDQDFGRLMAQRYAVKLIPRYTHAISQADGHADQQGNIEIASAIHDTVERAIKARCRRL